MVLDASYVLPQFVGRKRPPMRRVDHLRTGIQQGLTDQGSVILGGDADTGAHVRELAESVADTLSLSLANLQGAESIPPLRRTIACLRSMVVGLRRAGGAGPL